MKLCCGRVAGAGSLGLRGGAAVGLRAGDRAWIALGVGIVAYQAAAHEDELMSEAVDRWLERHPWVVRMGVALVATHLVNVLPEGLDPLHQLFLLKARFRA